MDGKHRNLHRVGSLGVHCTTQPEYRIQRGLDLGFRTLSLPNNSGICAGSQDFGFGNKSKVSKLSIACQYAGVCIKDKARVLEFRVQKSGVDNMR